MSDFDLKAMADTVRDALLADPFFSGIPAPSGAQLVISDDPHDIVTEIDKALNQIGLGLVVLPISAQECNPELPQAYFEKIPVVVKIFENPTVNRAPGSSNPTAQDTAVNVVRALHYFQPSGVDEVLRCIENIPVADEDYQIRQVTFMTRCGLTYTRAQIAPVVATPTTPGNQDVVLSCATPGAAIWYTLDGTYPAPRQPTAILALPYAILRDGSGNILTDQNGNPLLGSAPIAVSAGQQLRARAWLAGYAPTNPAEISVQY